MSFTYHWQVQASGTSVEYVAFSPRQAEEGPLSEAGPPGGTGTVSGRKAFQSGYVFDADNPGDIRRKKMAVNKANFIGAFLKSGTTTIVVLRFFVTI
jgi:hypothetical protein